MLKSDKINIGIAGTGTVGSKLIEMILKNKNFNDCEINLKSIYARNIKKAKKQLNFQGTIYDNYYNLTQDPEIDIIVELIGGADIAFDIVEQALINKKTVITANKFLLSQHWNKLFCIAKEKKVEIGFEAAVAGAIPIIKTIQSQLQDVKVKTVIGILNGTTNYILSKMKTERLEYEDALKEAQKKGFAESDPTFDIQGIDSAHKIYILALLLFKKHFDFQEIMTQGIDKISYLDIYFAQKLGYNIKLLAYAQINKNEVKVKVEPVFIKLSHFLANIHNEMNAIYYESDYGGNGLLVGAGAGGTCTASSVLSDIITYGIRRKHRMKIQNFVFSKQKLSQKENEYQFYLRFTTIETVGVISQITRILSNYNISIYYIEQTQKNNQENEFISIIILTHSCKETIIQKTIEEIDLRKIIKKPTLKIKIEI